MTLIHVGDIHGHMVPRPNLRSDGNGEMEGGLARMYTVIEGIRDRAGRHATLLVNTGDTLQGSGEALFTRGQALIDVLNMFNIQADAPGNWDFLYGTSRFEEVFKGPEPIAPWNATASNLYYTDKYDPTTVCGRTGGDGGVLQRVLPPYVIKRVGNLKVGLLGFTTARAIAAVGTTVTRGYQFTDGEVELPCLIDVLRSQEKVDLLVVISELEMARDIELATLVPGIDVVLNSDMHERTTTPIEVQHADGSATWIVEEGQDGTMVGELKVKVRDGQVTERTWTPHIVTQDIAEDPGIKAKVEAVRAPFLTGTFVPGQTVTVGGNTTTLVRPVDEVIATTQVGLHRSNFMDEALPGVVEGTSHDLIADAMRWAAGTDIASIRGFRYGTHVPAGAPITMEDLFHYVPVVAKMGLSTTSCGADLNGQVQQSTKGTFNPDPKLWSGGWMFGYSGVSFDLDACGGFPDSGIPDMPANPGSNIRVHGVAIDPGDTYDAGVAACNRGGDFSAAGYWFNDDPNTINNCAGCRGRETRVVMNDLSIVTVPAGAGLEDTTGVLDVTEAVVKYLRADASAVRGGLGGLNGEVTVDDVPTGRISVKRLPNVNPFGFRPVQPLLGATADTCPALVGY